MPAESFNSEGGYYELPDLMRGYPDMKEARDALVIVGGQAVRLANALGWCVHRDGCICDSRSEMVLKAVHAMQKHRQALQEIFDLPLGAFASESKGIAQKALAWEHEVEPGGVTPY